MLRHQISPVKVNVNGYEEAVLFRHTLVSVALPVLSFLQVLRSYKLCRALASLTLHWLFMAFAWRWALKLPLSWSSYQAEIVKMFKVSIA